MTEIVKEPFGCTADGAPVARWTMRSPSGMTVRVLEYGCTIQSIVVPDRDGHPVDVALGYDTLADYEAGGVFFGAFVGRYANRIKNAAFTLGGRTYQLEKNDGNNHLHGTYIGRVFSASAEDGALVFRYESPDGEEGYPGALSVTVTYRLTDDNTLILDYRAVTDADTVVNLTNHTYFNLAGHDSGDVLDQYLQLEAPFFTEMDAETIPTGKILPVDGTALDFRRAKTIGADIEAEEESIRFGCGYDHNLILQKAPGPSVCGTAWSPKTGIEMTFSTTHPAVQLYSGNYLGSGSEPDGKGVIRYGRRGGFCLESQHYPCSPNYPDFPSTVLKPGEEYHETTGYGFGIRDC